MYITDRLEKELSIYMAFILMITNKNIWEKLLIINDYHIILIWMFNHFYTHWYVINTDIQSKEWINILFIVWSGLIIRGRNVWGRKRNSKNSLSLFSLSIDYISFIKYLSMWILLNNQYSSYILFFCFDYDMDFDEI